MTKSEASLVNIQSNLAELKENYSNVYWLHSDDAQDPYSSIEELGSAISLKDFKEAKSNKSLFTIFPNGKFNATVLLGLDNKNYPHEIQTSLTTTLMTMLLGACVAVDVSITKVVAKITSAEWQVNVVNDGGTLQVGKAMNFKGELYYYQEPE
jgi:hypothetical protein